MNKYREVLCHSCKPYIVKGAFITAYHKGYHRVTRVIEQIKHGGPILLVEYYQVVTARGTKSRNHTLRTCHVDYCELVDPNAILKDKQDELNTLYSNLVNAANGS